MKEEGADIAVVVPWGGDRLDLLLRQVDCLLAQDIDEPLEIRVAANRSVPLGVEQDLLTRSRRRRTVRIVDATSRPGPAHARNEGAEPVREILLFCDADDEADRTWAREMSAALRNEADLVGGVLDYSRLNAVPFALSRTLELPIAFHHLPFTPSASMGINGRVFAELGGFDEDLVSGEDIDLCWRAQYAGRRIAFVPEARVAYRLRQTWSQLFDQGRRYGGSDLQLYQRHRGRGLTRRPRDTLEELARVAVLGVFALRGTADRLKLAAKLGTVVGHAEGSLRARTLFL